MNLQILKASASEVLHFRALFLHEANFQFICNKCHDYGWADVYLFFLDGQKIGYGSVWGTNRREDRDTIFEFYVLPAFRKLSDVIFREFHAASKTILIESQSNDLQLTAMLYRFAQNIHAEAILFEDELTTSFTVPGTVFRKVNEHDYMNGDDSDYVLTQHGELAASGGLMFNYNHPYADIYMQVKEPFRRQGLGSLIVQELKVVAYSMGRVPAARCNINNAISKATLVKAGFKVCGYRLKGTVTL